MFLLMLLPIRSARAAERRFRQILAAAVIVPAMLTSPPAGAQDPRQTGASDGSAGMRYTIAFPNRLHHEAEVEIELRDLDPSQPIELRMSRTSPGRYRLHEFARNVYNVTATDGGGNRLSIERDGLHGWTIADHGGNAVIGYTVFGDMLSGTYSAIDGTHAHLNPPSIFAWVRGLERRPIELHLDLPETSWAVATQLAPTGDPTRFTAGDLWAFMDSPIEASDFIDRRWTFTDQAGASAEFRMTFHHDGDNRDIESYVADTQAVVAESAAVFGELPRFDHGRYTFMVDYLPWATGSDAMEHRNSTPLVDIGTIRDDSDVLIETLVHEFFHAWNVERLRPASIEPFDFENPVFSGELWFAEGFTNYYDGLLLHRAGIWPIERYLEDLTRTVRTITLSPAPRFGSPRAMSEHAPFRDRGTWRDPQNDRNTYLHYYYYGDALGLALDLELRSRGTSLDLLMQRLWRSHGRDEVPYTVDDLQGALGGLIDDEAFASQWFDDHVRNSKLPDYPTLLATVGMTVQPPDGAKHWWGEAELEEVDGGLEVTSRTRIGTPLYRAGVDLGDVLIELDGRSLRKVTGFQRQLDRADAGSALPLLVRSRTGLSETSLVIEPTRDLVVVPVEEVGERPTAAQLAARQAWLASRAGGGP